MIQIFFLNVLSLRETSGSIAPMLLQYYINLYSSIILNKSLVLNENKAKQKYIDFKQTT